MCFRDFAATHASGYRASSALESTSGFRGGSVVVSRGQCDSRWNFVGSALSAYLDKCDRFSEEPGAGSYAIRRFAVLENSSVDPGRDWGGARWESFCDTNACEPENTCNSKYQLWTKRFSTSEYECPGGNACDPALSRPGFFAEGIKKFMFPAEWGVGRFEKIGIIYPHLARRLLASWRLSVDSC